MRALRLTAERALAAHAGAKHFGRSAVQLLISWAHPGRLRSEAALAMLAGVASIPASSGRVVRHRLNRGGDRR